jgi:hypothetical protein
MTLLPGVYPVWIGSYRENTTPSFILDLQTFEPGLAESATVLAPNLPATLGTLALAGPTSTATRTGIAGGLVNASLLGSSCRGYIPAGPHLTLTTTGYGHVVLSTRATGDLTLVVRDAQGALHCDDDSGGSMQPRVAAMLPAGQHQVWVGTYGAGERTSFDLMVRGEGINATEPLRNELRPEAIPTIATLDLDRESSAQLRGNIAGTVEARRISPGCVGWMMAAPQLRMVTRTPRHVTIAATSSRGLTLMVRGPGGDVVCADEHNGSPNPTLEADIGVGETNVWIGSYSFSASPTRFRVQVTSQAPRVARSVK